MVSAYGFIKLTILQDITASHLDLYGVLIAPIAGRRCLTGHPFTEAACKHGNLQCKLLYNTTSPRLPSVTHLSLCHQTPKYTLSRLASFMQAPSPSWLFYT